MVGDRRPAMLDEGQDTLNLHMGVIVHSFRLHEDIHVTESDRYSCVTNGKRKMGRKVKILPNFLTSTHSPLYIVGRVGGPSVSKSSITDAAFPIAISKRWSNKHDFWNIPTLHTTCTVQHRRPTICFTVRGLCNGPMFRLEGHISPSTPLTSLSQYSIIILDPSLWRELSRLSDALFFFFFFQVDGSILVRNPFSYEHLSQCVHYSWRPITPDRLSWPLKKKAAVEGGGRV